MPCPTAAPLACLRPGRHRKARRRSSPRTRPQGRRRRRLLRRRRRRRRGRRRRPPVGDRAQSRSRAAAAARSAAARAGRRKGRRRRARRAARRCGRGRRLPARACAEGGRACRSGSLPAPRTNRRTRRRWRSAPRATGSQYGPGKRRGRRRVRPAPPSGWPCCCSKRPPLRAPACGPSSAAAPRSSRVPRQARSLTCAAASARRRTLPSRGAAALAESERTQCTR
mmetsp:Transcript_10516/g.34458  ORF Transcript_10516/g.34458 Transcript_10516/m.34458 type:complete len:225 (+) Transcript_10516:1673-2347(+)